MASEARDSLVSLVCLVVWFVWLNETNQTNKTNQMNPSRPSRWQTPFKPVQTVGAYLRDIDCLEPVCTGLDMAPILQNPLVSMCGVEGII